MTIAAILLFGLQNTPKPVDKPTLEYYQDHFVVREGRHVYRAGLKPEAPKPVLSVAYRRNHVYAVWDERGLTVRTGGRSHSTRLEDVAVSPRAFSKAEIKETVDLIHRGMRAKAATSLAGSRRLGEFAYFLVRWSDRKGEPWLEALVRVNLKDPELWPHYVGRFEGFSRADRPLDDRLMVFGGRLAVVTQTPTRWGVATCNPKTLAFDFRSLGDRLLSLSPSGLFVERTHYGAFVAGQIDLHTGDRKVLGESPDPLRFLDGDDPPITIARSGPATILRNAWTGTLTQREGEVGAARVGPYVAIWRPLAKPRSAAIYDPSNWSIVATWQTK